MPDGESLFEGIERFQVAAQREVRRANVGQCCCFGGLLTEFVFDRKDPLKMYQSLSRVARM